MYIPSLSLPTLLLLSASSSFMPSIFSADAFSMQKLHKNVNVNVNININANANAMQSSSLASSSSSILPTRHYCRLYQSSSSSTESSSSIESDSESSAPSKRKTKKLTLLTFDLDDTLYPISKIINEANVAFARVMIKFGYKDIDPFTIVSTAKDIRERMAITDPEQAACITHTEIRRLAIREEMEKIVYERKLQSCADDWATQVSSLSPLVVNNAKTWAHTAVSPSVVEAVLNAWEMERHHAAERHLYPEVIDTITQIQEEHPNVIIGAVTDGKADPLLMTFTLAKHFDYCINWEDDQSGRKKFFTDLSNVEKDADLKWIYNLTKEKGEEMIQAQALIRGEEYPDEKTEGIWIHIGDDLALDVGGSAAVGAKTIFAELDDKTYGQTARHRFDLNEEKQPDWSTTPMTEIEKRKVMNEEAQNLVCQKVAFISHIPEAINNILEMED